MQIIGLTGKAGAGKTTVAMHLERHYGFKRLSFAEPLKRMLIETGLATYEELYVTKTPMSRKLMQVIGTDIIRNRVDKDFWVKQMAERIIELTRSGYFRFVIDDVRFQNEADFIRRLGGIVILITRDCKDRVTDYNHESERLDLIVDATVTNNRDIDSLAMDILAITSR